VPHPGAICQRLDDGVVIFSIADQTYYGLNPVGAEVWALLERSPSFDALCATLGESYPAVSPATLRSDVRVLLTDLLRFGLVVPPPATPPSGSPATPTSPSNGSDV